MPKAPPLYNVSMPNSEADREILEMALVGYEAELLRINGEITKLRGGSNGRRVKRTYTKRAAVEEGLPVRKRRKMSVEARKRIGDAIRARWAAAREAKQFTPKRTTSKKRLKLSAEERAKISGGQARTKGKNSDVPF